MMGLEDRIKQLIAEEEAGAGNDTFADRADAYYRRRPRLMALLHDLYHQYVSLVDRHTRSLTKLVPTTPTTTSTYSNNVVFQQSDDGCISDAESTLSYQPSTICAVNNTCLCSSNNKLAVKLEGGDVAVVELVMKSVEHELMKQELEESCRKIELQRRLVEVLESERLVLLGDNSRLGYRAEVLAEENAFLKRRASQLAMRVMSMQEHHRAEALSRQIQHLQRQIYSLEENKNNNINAPPAMLKQQQPQSGGGNKWRSWLKKIAAVGPCGPS